VEEEEQLFFDTMVGGEVRRIFTVWSSTVLHLPSY